MSVVTCICDDDDKLADSWVISSAASVSTTCEVIQKAWCSCTAGFSLCRECVATSWTFFVSYSAIYIIMIRKILIHEF